MFFFQRVKKTFYFCLHSQESICCSPLLKKPGYFESISQENCLNFFLRFFQEIFTSLRSIAVQIIASDDEKCGKLSCSFLFSLRLLFSNSLTSNFLSLSINHRRNFDGSNNDRGSIKFKSFKMFFLVHSTLIESTIERHLFVFCYQMAIIRFSCV